MVFFKDFFKITRNFSDDYKQYIKLREEAESELAILVDNIWKINKIAEKSNVVKQILVYQEIEEYLENSEKELVYAGARSVPIAILLGVFTSMLGPMIFSYTNQQGIYYEWLQFIDDLIKNNGFLRLGVLSISLLVLITLCLLFFIGLIYNTMIRYVMQSDNNLRKKIIRHQIMLKLAKKQIAHLKSFVANSEIDLEKE